MIKTQLIQLGKYYPPFQGGMETHLYDQCNWLKNAFNIEVLVANDCSKTVSERIDDVNITRVANFGEVFSSPICPTLPYHLRHMNGKADSIIELHMPNPMAHLAYLLSRPRGHLVLMWHSDIVRQRKLSTLYDPYVNRLLKRAERIIATSPDYILHSPYLSKFSDKCVVVPLGVDLNRFDFNATVDAKRNHIKQKHPKNIVLFVGRLTYYKGLENLIEAAVDIDADIVMVGNGPLKEALQQKIVDSGLHHKIFMYHDVNNSDLVAFYHACDIFVLPSNARSEAFGVVQLEAMACGKPVISTKLTTGVPWVNQNGITGVTVEPDSPRCLKNAINDLLRDEPKRKLYGNNARVRVEKDFSDVKTGQQLETVLFDILQDRH